MPDSFTSLIAGDAELAEHCERWAQRNALGLDTEFFRERTYHPLPALAQVTDGEGCWLVDLMALDDLAPLFRLLAEDRVIKVMHAPGQDLELFRLMGAEPPRALYDTQLAAVLAGLGEGPGYQSLVSDLLEIDLPKSETRSDWRQRPLSEAQKHYAAQDVAYLLPLKETLDERLAALGRADWHREECERLVEQAWVTDDTAGLRKLRQAWRLPPANQALLRTLWLWRERRARELDRPRQRVLRDGPLQQIARELPDSNGDLARLDLPPGWIRRFGAEVLAQVAEARTGETKNVAPVFQPPANRGPAAETLKKLRKTVSQISEKEGLPPSFLVNRQTLEALALDPPQDGLLPPELRGWRESVVGPALLTVLEEAPGAGEEG